MGAVFAGTRVRRRSLVVDRRPENAADSVNMQWARENGCVVFTHDLDFGILLAHSKDRGPSVIQARTQDVSPDHLGPVIVGALQAHREALEQGALLTIDPSKSRLRILPF